ncbi:MAG: response regulator [Desulfobacterales bacterium]|nr:response regulator [Desulfobacterales bacterium]
MGDDEKSLILIIDDDQKNIQVLASALEENGYEYALFLEGDKALKYLRNEKPDLILLDILMPGMDGYEVCREIKRDNTNKNIPIIFLTAKTEMEDLVKGFDLGCVDYIRKPFQIPEMLARVKTYIGYKRALDEINTLRGIIPICVKCKKVRDDEGLWGRVELYIEAHSDASFSQGMCPECMEKCYGSHAWQTPDNGG